MSRPDTRLTLAKACPPNVGTRIVAKVLASHLDRIAQGINRANVPSAVFIALEGVDLLSETLQAGDYLDAETVLLAHRILGRLQGMNDALFASRDLANAIRIADTALSALTDAVLHPRA